MNERDKHWLTHHIEMAENGVIGAQNEIFEKMTNDEPKSGRTYGRLNNAIAELRQALDHVENACLLIKNIDDYDYKL